MVTKTSDRQWPGAGPLTLILQKLLRWHRSANISLQQMDVDKEIIANFDMSMLYNKPLEVLNRTHISPMLHLVDKTLDLDNYIQLEKLALIM